MPEQRTAYRRTTRLLVGATLAALVSGVVALPSTASAETRTLFVTPGAGGDCSAAAPCGSVAAAYARANSGDTIALGTGFYPRQDIAYRSAATGWTANVVVTAAPGASPTLGGLNVYSPRLTVRGLPVQGYMALYKGADHSRLENLDIQGGAAIAGAHDTAVVGSRIRPPRDLDALQIKPYNTGDTPPRNVLVEGNDLGPGYLSSGSSAHVDSLQVLGVTNLTVRGNLVREAASNSMIIGEGMGQVRDVLVEDNVFEQCRPFRAECNAYNAIWPGIDLENVVIRHNTILGSAYAAVPSGTTFTRNIVTAKMTCTAPVLDNLVEPSSVNCAASNVKASPVFGSDGRTLVPGSPYAGYGTRTTVPSVRDALAPPAPSPSATPTSEPTPAPTTAAPVPATASPTASPTTSPTPSSTSSPAPTGPVTTGVLGATTPGGATVRPGSGYKFGTSLTASQQGTLSAFRFHAQGGSSPQKFIPAVYTASNGTPQSLISKGSEVIVPAATSARWYTAPLAPAQLEPGASYVLALLAGDSTHSASLAYQPTTGAGVWNANPYGALAPIWGTVNREDYAWSFAVEYTTADSAASPSTSPSASVPPSPPASPSTSTSPTPTVAPIPSTSPSPSPIVTSPTTVAATFGATAAGTTSASPGAGYKWGSTYMAANDGVSSHFSFYVRGGSSKQRFRPLVYSVDAAGSPGSLLGTGSEVVIRPGSAATWATSALTGVRIESGKRYFLALHSGANHHGAHIYATPLSGAGQWNSDRYPDGASSSFGRTTTEPLQWNFRLHING